MSDSSKRISTGSKLLAVVLSVIMVLSVMPVITLTTAPTAEAYGTYNKSGREYYYASGTQFIYQLAYYYSSSSNGDAEDNLRGAGFTPWGHNFNAGDGHSSKYVHSGYKTTTDPTVAIKGVLVATGHPTSLNYNGANYYTFGYLNPQMPQVCDWDKDPDLNKGNGGDNLYFLASADRAAGPAITSLSMGQDDDAGPAQAQLTNNGYNIATNQSGNYQDTNAGAGGDFNYVGYKSTCQEVDSSPLRNYYNNALARYNESDYAAKYTSASRTALQNALSNAESILIDLNDGYTTTNQSTIDSRATALNNAIQGLTVNTYTVTFKAYTSGTTLGTVKTQTVTYSYSATPPASYSISMTNDGTNHYTFKEWSGSYTNVTSNRTITATYNVIPHTYGTPQYLWASDGRSCAATATCSACGYTKNASGTISSSVKTPATCAAKGTTTYTAAFSAPFSNQTKDVQDIAINSSNHTGETELRNYRAATCNADGYSGDTYCKGCGVKLATGAVVPSTGEHTYKGVVTTPATCMLAGEMTYTCTGCGVATYTEVISATGHDFGDPTYQWAADGSVCFAYRICSRCQGRQSEYAANITPETKTAATCAAKGVTTYTAAFTAENSPFTTQTKDIADIDIDDENHTGETEVRDAVEPNCRDDGYTGDTYCVGCGVKLSSGTAIASTGEHAWGTGVITTDPTCTGKGVRTFTCSGCGSIDTKDIDPTGHTPAEAVEENRVEPTCTATGSYDKVVYCSVCGDEISRDPQTIPTVEHVEAEPVVENEVAATCKDEGSYDLVVYCTVGGEEISREHKTIPTTDDHKAGDPVMQVNTPATCSAAGSCDMVVYCSVCGQEMSRESNVTINPTDHVPGATSVENKVDPTCSAEGSYDEVTYCFYCEQPMETEHHIIPKKNHVGGAPEIEEGSEVPPTCTSEGSYVEVIKCMKCGEEISRETKAIGTLEHSWDDGVVTKEATAKEAGVKTYTCSICGATKTEAIEKLDGSCPLCHDEHDAGLIDKLIGLIHKIIYFINNLLKKA